jgi:hypothetical protein
MRVARATLRVALRQLKALDKKSVALAAWLSVHDRFDPVEAEDSPELHPTNLSSSPATLEEYDRIPPKEITQ